MENSDQIKLMPLMKILMSLMKSRFWGQLTIKFKDGEAVLVNQEQQIKLN